MEFFTQSQFDEFRSLDFRQLFGTGFRNPIHKSDKNYAYVGYGIFYENETYSQAPDEERIRANFYVTYATVIRENVEFSTVLYFQPDIDQIEDVRVIFTPAMKTKISDKLSMLASVDYSLDSKPVNDNKEYDLSYNMGLTYDF